MKVPIKGILGVCQCCQTPHELTTEVQILGERKIPDETRNYRLIEHYRPMVTKEHCFGSGTEPIRLVEDAKVALN